MSLFKTSTSRRREIRKTMARQRPLRRERVGRPQLAWGVLLGLLLLAGAAAIVLDARQEPAYRPGQLVDRAQVARTEFSHLSPEAVERARQNARAKEPAIYTPNRDFLQATEKKLLRLPAIAASVASPAQVAEDIRRQFKLDEAALEALRQHASDGRVAPGWEQDVRAFTERLRRKAILRSDRFQIEKVQTMASTVRLRTSEDSDLLVSEEELIDISAHVAPEANQEEGDQKGPLARAIGRLADGFAPAIRTSLTHYFRRADEPTYELDREATENARRAAAEAAAESVEPNYYEPNQVLVSAGAKLGPGQFRLLRAERRAYFGSLGWPVQLGRQGGLVLLIGAAVLGLALASLVLQPRIARNPMRALGLTALLLATLGLAWAVRPLSANSQAAAAMGPALLTAVILAIAYEQRFAVAASALHAVLIALALQLSVGLYVVMLAGCLVAILQLRQVRHRGLLIRCGLVTGLVVAAGVVAAGLAERQLVEGIFAAVATEAVLAALATVAVGFFVLGVLPFIERAFKVTTAMTLLELCDVNQPLLRRLAQNAPGTYNHSLQVGNLAEAAAEAIGANSLLTRVGAYYHDIGKMNKPQYFVENHMGGANPHERVSPAMSLLIIVGHVKDGMEMAREFGLPPVLHHFIESHHGTTLVEYFYHAARKQQGRGRKQPEEIEYRYPGPKPYTKEAATVMVADAVESASRSMSEPTATRIEQLVHKLVTKRLLDGQFDQCDITFAELRQVEQAVTKALAAIYHGRIAYPGDRSGGERSRPGRPAREAAAV